MNKWADYGVSSVKYDADRRIAKYFRVHPDRGDHLGPPAEYDRPTIIDALKSGLSFVAVESEGSEWRKGRALTLETVRNAEFLSIDNIFGVEERVG